MVERSFIEILMFPQTNINIQACIFPSQEDTATGAAYNYSMEHFLATTTDYLYVLAKVQNSIKMSADIIIGLVSNFIVLVAYVMHSM